MSLVSEYLIFSVLLVLGHEPKYLINRYSGVTVVPQKKVKGPATDFTDIHPIAAKTFQTTNINIMAAPEIKSGDHHALEPMNIYVNLEFYYMEISPVIV